MKPPHYVPRVRLRQVREGRMTCTVERVTGPEDVHGLVQRYYRGADREILSVLCLDSQNRPTCFHVASIGGLNTTRTRPAEILKVALLSNACAIVLIHNHPSGEAEPSTEDLEFTRTVRQAAELLGVELYDHLIVGGDRYCSLRERGMV